MYKLKLRTLWQILNDENEKTDFDNFIQTISLKVRNSETVVDGGTLWLMKRISITRFKSLSRMLTHFSN